MRTPSKKTNFYFEMPYPRWGAIAHYYGDMIRSLFLGGTALMVFAAPFYTEELFAEIPFIIIGAVVFVALAGLTNPVSKFVMTANATCAGAAAIVYGAWGLLSYTSEDPIAFVLREVIAIIFFFALYFSVKTLRNMLMGIIGQEPGAGFTSEGNGNEDADEGIWPASRRDPTPEDGLGNPSAPEDPGTD